MKNIYNGDKTIKLCLWDTAGQEKFRSLIPSYLSDAVMAIIVYDITSKNPFKIKKGQQSFEAVDDWIQILRDKRGNDASIALVGNKIDMEDKRVVTLQDGMEKAKASDAFFMEVSAKSGEKVFDLFRTLTASLVDNQAPLGPDTDIQLNVPKKKVPLQKKRKKNCCKSG